MLTRLFCGLAALFSVTAQVNPALASTAGGSGIVLDMWLRRPLTAGNTNPKGNLMSLDIKGLTPEILESYDIQYERDVKVRGFHLRNLLGLMKPIPENVDIMLLHTRNGMIVPISIARLRSDIQVFVALEIWRDGKWTSEFPTSVRIATNAKNEVPTTFVGNKVVVGQEWRATETGFTPWRHIDSLTGVEFVESAAYFDQFQNKKKPKTGLEGRLAFIIHCQYCHGVKGLGATRAPEMTALVQRLEPKAWSKIYDQVQNPASGGAYPHFMPKQKDFSKKNAKGLVSWITSMRDGELSPYEPSYEGRVEWR